MKWGYNTAFQWLGGKFFELDFILPLVPRNVHHFVDVFGGAAYVIMNVPPCPIMTYNDIDCELAHFFRTLRDDREKLIEALLLTPYSRAEFALAISDPPAGMDDIERARRFYVRARGAVMGKGGWPKLTARNWGRVINGPNNTQVLRWVNSIEHLHDIADIFMSFQIDCDPALEIIKAYDGPNTFFYCDPPYVVSTRSHGRVIYKNEMSDADHRELAEVLKGVEARVMVSGYPGELYDEIFEGWTRVMQPSKFEFAAQNKQHRSQAVWLNYPVPDGNASRQEGLPI